MFKKLQQRWKVTPLNLVLVLATFAIGGSLCGFISRKLIGFLGLEKGILWVIVYIVLLTITWPGAVMLVSIPLGQFNFFRKYILRIFSRMAGRKPGNLAGIDDAPAQLAIFASGAGSNARKIIEHFQHRNDVHVALIVCNKTGAGVVDIAREFAVPVLLIEKERFTNGDAYVPELQAMHITHIILAGFLWKLPLPIIQNWQAHIVNIHPALLPAYGGKGMYGSKVHEAVIANKEKQSGISIHYVDEIYDHGQIIFQEICDVLDADTAESLAEKIHALEHAHYPVVIEKFVKAKTTLKQTPVTTR